MYTLTHTHLIVFFLDMWSREHISIQFTNAYCTNERMYEYIHAFMYTDVHCVCMDLREEVVLTHAHLFVCVVMSAPT